MTATRRGVLALAAILCAVSLAYGDRPPAPGRVRAGLAAPAHRAGATAVARFGPRFALFGWVSPPRDSATAARYAELADAGLNVTVLAWEDSGLASHNRARLEYTRPHGVRNLLLDMDLAQIRFTDPVTYRWADSVVARYRDDPAFLGYYLGDEPSVTRFSELASFFRILRERDPAHPAWNNLLGRNVFSSRAAQEAYTRAYIDSTQPAVLCTAHYDFTTTGDRHQLVENVAVLSAIARERGLPFWGIVQLVQHGVFRAMTDGLLRYQVAQWLSYGASGIGYFTYWTPAPDPEWNWQPAMIAWGSGARTPLYDMVRTLNAKLLPIGEVLAGTSWLATEHAGSVPPGGTPFAPDSLLASVEGRATIGEFVDSTGAPHLLVANADSLASRSVTLVFAGHGRRAWRLRAQDDWEELAVSAAGRCVLAFAPGDFALLRLSGTADSLAAGHSRLRLDVGPNPARGLVRLALGGFTGEARLELLDLSGRRVWSRRFSGGGSAAAEWRGERDGGGRVPAGAYFARFEDPLGVIVRRVQWLGGS